MVCACFCAVRVQACGAVRVLSHFQAHKSRGPMIMLCETDSCFFLVSALCAFKCCFKAALRAPSTLATWIDRRSHVSVVWKLRCKRVYARHTDRQTNKTNGQSGPYIHIDTCIQSLIPAYIAFLMFLIALIFSEESWDKESVSSIFLWIVISRGPIWCSIAHPINNKCRHVRKFLEVQQQPCWFRRVI